MNMQEVREAAERVVAPLNMNDDDAITERKFDANMVARALLALTNPTPLTEELLFEKAKVVSQLYGHWVLYFTGFHVVLATEGRRWKTSQLQPLHISPNTLGELTMLELLMEGR